MMLIRNVEPGEVISLSPNVKITVIKSGDRYVRLGFEAPPSVKIIVEHPPPLCDNVGVGNEQDIS